MRLLPFLVCVLVIGCGKTNPPSVMTTDMTSSPRPEASPGSTPAGSSSDSPSPASTLKETCSAIIGSAVAEQCKNKASVEGDCEPNPFDKSLCIKKGSQAEWLKTKTCADIKEAVMCPSTDDKTRVAIAGEGTNKEVCRAITMPALGICEKAPSNYGVTAGCKPLNHLVMAYQMYCHTPCKTIIDKAECSGDAIRANDGINTRTMCEWRKGLLPADPIGCLGTSVENDAKDYAKFVCDVKNGFVKMDWITNSTKDGLIHTYTHDTCKAAGVQAVSPYNAAGKILFFDGFCE